MITSDAHEGIQDAISNVFPEVPWQRCQFHFAMNISGKSPKKYQAGIRAELQEMWNCDTIEAARKSGTPSSLTTETLLNLPCHALMKALKVP